VIRRPLGSTGLRVSVLSVGTVSLGTEYGIPTGSSHGPPPRDLAVGLLRTAADAGINLFDTAPAYGDAETILGEALGNRPECLFATKVALPRTGVGASGERSELERHVRKSIDASRRALRRGLLDIVQIHNATAPTILEGDMAEVLHRERAAGRIRFVGATVYTEDEALAAVRAGAFDLIQVPFNVLDRAMATRVFPEARAAGVGVVVRSVFLKGALTPKARWLPDELGELRRAAVRLMQETARSWKTLPELAVRYCLSVEGVSSVLVGPRTEEELLQALEATDRGPLGSDVRARVEQVHVGSPTLLNPATWPIP